VGPSVRTSTKSFSDFHLICVGGRPRPGVRASVTSTRSKVKVKVMEFPKLRKVHFSRSISSAGFAWSSKLMVGGHSMGPGLQLVGARFFNFLIGKLSREFKHRPVSIFHETSAVDILRGLSLYVAADLLTVYTVFDAFEM